MAARSVREGFSFLAISTGHGENKFVDTVDGESVESAPKDDFRFGCGP